MSRPQPPSPRPLARQGQHFAPHMMLIFVAAALTAILGPLISYRSDVSEVREQAHQRVARDARLYAEAFEHHLALLEAELTRLASRPEVDLADEKLAPEQALLEVSHRSSALFLRGVAFVNESGSVMGSQPSPLQELGASAAHEVWFQELLKTGAPAYGLIRRGSEGLLVISAPIRRGSRMTGAIVGVVGAFPSALPQVDALGDARIALLDQRDQMVIFGDAAPWASVAMLERIAGSPRSPVLFLGETGSGKEVLARHLHALTFGQDAPFVHVNCAALPATTIESELFGYERGAFTDARVARRGLAEVASGGTLFLDEVGELPLDLQPKILTFLDSGRFRKLGGVAEQSSTARVVAATNRDLPKQIASGAFREDLWFRLSVFRIDVPPLRERPEDVVLLAQSILADLAAELGRREARLGPRALERLAGYPFPGNVRELRSVLERALVLAPGPELELGVLASAPPSASAPVEGGFHLVGPPVEMDELERRYARHVLEQMGGRRMEAAKALGISYPTFLKRIGVDEDE